MTINALYETSARATGGRDGRVATLDGSLDLKLTTPKGLGGGFGLKVAMAVALPGFDQTAAEALVGKAHEACPYSNATRNNIEVTFTINDVPLK